MAGNEVERLPRFDSLDELIEHFDTHVWGDYLEQMPVADFDVDIEQRVHFVALDADLADRLTEIARTKHTLSEAHVNTWVRERVLADAPILRKSGTGYHRDKE